MERGGKMSQPRPQGAFPWPTSKAREKRPGDEVENERTLDLMFISYYCHKLPYRLYLYFFILFIIEPVNAKCILISTAAIAYFKALFLFR